MKILYISPENTVGILNLWKQCHENKGNECTFITLYKSKHKYDPGICLDLPLVYTSPWYLSVRNCYYWIFSREQRNLQEKKGYPPTWKPNTYLENIYFQFRDWLWHFKIESVIDNQKLSDYDIIH